MVNINIITFGGKLTEISSTESVLHLEEGKNKVQIRDEPLNGLELKEESATQIWLSYIISHYDKLADYTLFLSHEPTTHSLFKNEMQLLQLLKKEPSVFMDKTQWCFVLKCDGNGMPHHPGLPIKTWFTRLFPGYNAPSVFEFVRGGQRMMSRERIVRHPLSFYEDLLYMLKNDKINHFILERMWSYL